MFAARDLTDASELPTDGVATGGTVESMPMIVRVAVQQFETDGSGIFAPALLDAMWAKRRVVHQHIALAAVLPRRSGRIRA
ncbi:MAG: hypothetical protein HWE39_18040 [Oceanospirillaceae bacterium]|nr:hypothetical protein [Salipiger sp. HF18]NVK43151.1 hypothetical protein [Oceanospirillaceae bacterium]